MTTVSIVGSTGSIGTQAIDVIRAERDRFDVVALGAARNIELLTRQAFELRPSTVAVADPSLAAELSRMVPPGTAVLAGPEGLEALGEQGDVVLNGVVGFAGLPVTMAALRSGRRLALANKESLVAAGPVVQRVRATPGAEIVPVDSEHCAIHQCLRAGRAAEVAELVLTASGGPFRGRTAAELEHVSVEDALAHPTWSMGAKITVDSSTLMNKGLEVIEAHELFGIAYDDIRVVVHPQSVVHSMVTFTDGATVAQLSLPDMRLPIGYALAWPERSGTAHGPVDWSSVGSLDFEVPDATVFGCLALAYAAGRAGATAPAWINAANEVAVAAFLARGIEWRAIATVISATMDAWDGAPADELAAVLDADATARRVAAAEVERSSRAA